MESNIYHNKELSKEYVKPIIHDIMDDPSFSAARESFSKGQNLKGASDYLIAKDLFCDLFANKKSGVKLYYEDKLSDNIKEEIYYAIDKFESELKK